MLFVKYFKCLEVFLNATYSKHILLQFTIIYFDKLNVSYSYLECRYNYYIGTVTININR